MALGILGRKIGMTQVYDAAGNLIPVTVVEAGPCTVLQVRTKDKDGYEAVQLGFADKPRRLASRSERGHVAAIDGKAAKKRLAAGVLTLKKAECEPQRIIRELRKEAGDADYEVGQKLTVDAFEGVTAVDVVGVIKGRGTAGVMKQHNFSGLCASHGVKRHHRAPGSVASHSTERGRSGKIKKGKRMSGRWGNERVTIRNLRLIRIDKENNALLVCGAIPGPNGGYVLVRKTNKKAAVNGVVREHKVAPKKGKK
jgi:large subunit ribosomal protein L3